MPGRHDFYEIHANRRRGLEPHGLRYFRKPEKLNPALVIGSEFAYHASQPMARYGTPGSIPVVAAGSVALARPLRSGRPDLG